LLGAQKAKKVERPVVIRRLLKNRVQFAFGPLQISGGEGLGGVAQQSVVCRLRQYWKRNQKTKTEAKDFPGRYDWPLGVKYFFGA
jgi:hypothetical protein